MNEQQVRSLRRHLEEINQLTDEHWTNTLNDRKKTELQFHDKYRDRATLENIDHDTYEKLYGNEKYYSATTLSSDYTKNWIKNEAVNNIFLDYCCGNGSQTIEAAKAGSKLSIGIDISSISIENARQNAEEVKASANTYFVQADAENTLLPDNSIQRVICSGVLHHLDLNYAFPELFRILSPGGKILAIEALNYNPAIKLYRYLTPAMRTDWEKSHILSLKDIAFARNYFEIGEIRYWHILSIMEPHLPFGNKLLNSIDRILTRIPLIKLMSWIFTFELKKAN